MDVSGKELLRTDAASELVVALQDQDPLPRFGEDACADQ
jgi:hypothetical protein